MQSVEGHLLLPRRELGGKRGPVRHEHEVPEEPQGQYTYSDENNSLFLSFIDNYL